MSVKVLSAAVMAAVLGASPSLADLAGPAELPPSSYKGQQYVDSRGCVFLRAGYGGQVTWVPRVSRDRKQLCGYAPSGGKVEVAEEATVKAPKETPVAAAAAPTPVAKAEAAPDEVAKAAAKPAAKSKTAPEAVAEAAPKAMVKPKPTPAPAPTVLAAPAVVDRPPTATELAATSGDTEMGLPQGGANYRLACPADAPVPERFAVNTGGTKLLCTRGDGTLVGATFPRLVEGTTDGHAIGYDAHVAAGRGTLVPGDGAWAGEGTAATSLTISGKASKSAKYPDPVPPPGYKLAWKDDRLNPNRGKQTVDGFLAMDEIWTRTTPAELREDSAIEKKPVTIVVRRKDGSQTRHDGFVVSTKGGGKTVEFADPAGAKMVAKSTKAMAPEAAKPKQEGAAAKGSYLVQVGTFGVPKNAEGTASRLKGMGLPVARAKIKGGSLTVVYAGPFTSAAEAKSALAAARSAGFADARIVR